SPSPIRIFPWMSRMMTSPTWRSTIFMAVFPPAAAISYEDQSRRYHSASFPVNDTWRAPCAWRTSGRKGETSRPAGREYPESRTDEERAYRLAALRCWKHSLEDTGRPWVGLEGTGGGFAPVEAGAGVC